MKRSILVGIWWTLLEFEMRLRKGEGKKKEHELDCGVNREAKNGVNYTYVQIESCQNLYITPINVYFQMRIISYQHS